MLPDGLGTRIQRSVQQGHPLSAALKEFPDQFPSEDVALIEAGEATGHVDGNLDRLAEIHEERTKARRALLARSAYPLALLHFAALILPVAHLASQGRFTTANWLWEALSLLAPLWAIVLVILYLNRFAAWRDRFRAVIDVLPGFGGAARHHRRAIFASVLEAAYEAGVPMDRSLGLAARAAHEPKALRAAEAVSDGNSLALALTNARVLPAATVSRVATGEEAGDIAKTLRFIAEEERSKADAALKASMVALGVLITLVVMGWIAWNVISFYVNLYAGLGI